MRGRDVTQGLIDSPAQELEGPMSRYADDRSDEMPSVL
jgi:hypothetical protein